MDQDAPTSESAGQGYTRSEDFYFKDGDVVFRVGEVLYRLHSGILRSRIDVFKSLDILEHTHQASAPREGSDDQHPIVPPQVTSVEWEHLLTLLYKNLGPPPYPLDFLVSVLKLASQWGMPRSKEWAIDQIQTLVDNGEINSVLQFRLGVQYNRHEWLSEATHDIMRESLEDFTPYLADLLGFQAYQAVARLRERSMRQCVKEILGGLTLDVPRSVNCQHHDECTLAWKSAWSQRVVNLSSCDLDNWMYPGYAVMLFPPPSTMDIKCYKLAATTIPDSISTTISGIYGRTVDELMEELNQISFETSDLTAAAMVLAEE